MERWFVEWVHEDESHEVAEFSKYRQALDFYYARVAETQRDDDASGGTVDLCDFRGAILASTMYESFGRSSTPKVAGRYVFDEASETMVTVRWKGVAHGT